MPTPSRCPSCGGDLTVTRLKCGACEAVVEGEFSPCPVCRLDENERDLFGLFMQARGNLKDVQRELGVSYPTVRARIDRMFEQYEQMGSHLHTPMDVLKLLEAGEIDVDEAERRLIRNSV